MVSPVLSGVVVRSGFSMEDDSGILVDVVGAVGGGVTVVSGVVPRGPSVLEIGAVPFVTAGAVSAKTDIPSEKSSKRRTKNESKRNPLGCDMAIFPFAL